jgi:hypothetical protein
MLKVAPVSTKYLSLVSSSVRKISPALAGKCIAVTVACVELTAKPKMVRWQASFPIKHRMKQTVSLMGVVIVKFTHAIARVLKIVKIRAERE